MYIHIFIDLILLFPTVIKAEQEVFEVIKKAPFTVVVVFICFFSIWSVIGLAGFHTYLTTSDQTTNEDVSVILLHISNFYANIYIHIYKCAYIYIMYICT